MAGASDDQSMDTADYEMSPTPLAGGKVCLLLCLRFVQDRPTADSRAILCPMHHRLCLTHTDMCTYITKNVVAEGHQQTDKQQW